MIFVFGVITASNNIMFEAEEVSEMCLPVKGSIFTCSVEKDMWDETSWKLRDITHGIYKSRIKILDCTKRHEMLYFGFNGV